MLPSIYLDDFDLRVNCTLNFFLCLDHMLFMSFFLRRAQIFRVLSTFYSVTYGITLLFKFQSRAVVFSFSAWFFLPVIIAPVHRASKRCLVRVTCGHIQLFYMVIFAGYNYTGTSSFIKGVWFESRAATFCFSTWLFLLVIIVLVHQALT